VSLNLARQLGALERLGPVLDALPGPAFLVGGTVRDLLLRRPPQFDFDLAVVGDAEAFARELAQRLAGRVTTYDRFGTATVHYGDGAHVDVATARTEKYAAPGALPDVAPAASIEEDLARRDFTINAMAVALPNGDLVDPFEGQRHLADRLVRVLHEGSFVDDPTRIFRAARYEARLGFRMDPKTETLALMSLPELRRLSGARVREELVALLEEDAAALALQRLHRLEADRALNPELSFDEQGLIEALRELAARYGLPRARWELGLLSIAPPPGWLDELAVPRVVVVRVEAAIREAPALRARLREAWLTPAEAVEEIERTGPDTPLLALAQEDIRLLRDYFERWRHVRLDITGEDLAALGLDESPRVGEVLAELRRRKLNGGLEGRAEELAAARELIAG
jgi:tRNA nucleotidyltransferase (CCA-adding enzyme)